MKILLVSTYDTGGAAISCIRLHLGLLELGIDSYLLLQEKSKAIKQTEQFISNNSLLSRIKKKYHKKSQIRKELVQIEEEIRRIRNPRLELISFPYSDYDLTESKLYQEADIVHLHWVSTFLDWPSFFVKNKKPIVWTLHDQNPLLGYEHFNQDYFGIDLNGKPAKRILLDKEKELDLRVKEIKLNSLKTTSNLSIVAPSEWLFHSSRASEIFSKFEHYYIPYSIPCDTFKVIDQAKCRNELGLEQNKIVVLFVADNITNERKGLNFLINAINLMSDSEKTGFCFCAVGTNSNKFLDINYIGSFSEEKKMSVLYNAADLFVIPSLNDNLPNTMLESLSCGTPVIGFDVGGIRNEIEILNSGYVIKEISVENLKEAILKFKENKNLFERKEIASRAKERYDIKIQALKYRDVYEKILK